jgi:hypothetical protein
MPMLDERASESSVQLLHQFAFDQKIGSFAPCVPYGSSAGARSVADSRPRVCLASRKKEIDPFVQQRR